MREATRLPRRITGRAALTRSLLGLYLRVVKFSLHRATTPADRAWVAGLVDALAAALVAARDDARDDGRRTRGDDTDARPRDARRDARTGTGVKGGGKCSQPERRGPLGSLAHTPSANEFLGDN